ncbi:MAG: formate C-acetyltransferase/glycerol dehydratase family glycyl radical enzyme [Candidatus Lokiarchaeota archaeon]|nr:formate C-acetyltransferase/glycerol dehydratase family glycyl radical enzyme [Candidatus Lokiarchaeota archaeon]
MESRPLEELVREIPHLSLNVSLSYTRALIESPEKPMIIRQALGLEKTLVNLPTIIRPDEIIVGTFDNKIPVAIPRMEGSGFRILKELTTLPNREVNPINVKDEDRIRLEREIAPFYEKFKVDTYAREIADESVFETSFSGCAYVATEIGGIAHVVVDYPRLITIGLKEYITISQEKVTIYKRLETKEKLVDEKIAFYEAMIIICKSLINYSHKFSKYATFLAEKTENEERKNELLKIAEVCKAVPENPPRDLHEAIQFIWFVHMALHLENFEHGISFGRIDQYLWKFYDGNKETAVKLIKNLLLKTNEIIALYDTVATQYFGGMATTQNILIGGIDKNGVDATNDLTYIFLDATDQAAVPSPNLVVRLNKNTPTKLIKKIAEILAKGKNVIGIYNDELIVQTLQNCGLLLEEARDYGVVGCVGLSTSGTSYDNTGAIFLNMPKALELALGTDKSFVSRYIENYREPGNFKSIENVLEIFSVKLKALMRMAVTAANAYQQAHKVVKPTPLMSLCIRGSFEKGIDVNEGSAKYNFSGIHVTGFSDVVDSLAAIDWAVFKETKIKMEDLINSLKQNFRGSKDIQSYLMYKCPKYGNDDENADIYAQKAIKILAESVNGLKSARGGDYRVGIHAMTTHVGFGIFTGALPSGRRKGRPLNRDIAPGFTGEKGITAALNSVTKIDHSLLTNGVACTLNIDPNIVLLDDGRIFESILRTYVKLNGSHLQFNAISLETLVEAQKYPDIYKDLMVRVSGYSARYTELPIAVQDDIKERYCYSKL